MKIYTKTGDQGYTKLGTGSTVHKSDQRVACYGTVDELSSFIGLARSLLSEDHELSIDLIWVQRKLFQIGSILAFPGKLTSEDLGEVSATDLTFLETAIDRLTAELPPLAGFVLPGGTPTAAYVHCARSICRRAERLASTLNPEDYPLGANIVPFLNRLSDYLFCAARVLNYRGGQSEPLAKG